MDTSSLKTFAPKARTALIAEVTARVAAVLGGTSTERVELPTAVARLERAIVQAGGGATGRAAVAERVAYTWFNRIVALRFMDANGYTSVGVVSPPAGQTGGQPEVLTRARSGVIDADVVAPATAAKVTALLDGTRRSTDPLGEAYAALLEAYCRKWGETMRDMFGASGDETELLIPANLLADTSVRAQVADLLTKDVCEDVEVIGWLYQFYISERKDEVLAGFKKSKKAGPAEIPAATQLFTPDWIVRYLVENSLGRLWMLNNPGSSLRGQMEYYTDPVDEATDYLKIVTPEEIKVVDPACGSGHMLTYAFDLLYAIYEEEGYTPSEIPSLILANNLYGIEIDPRAEALAAFALTMKARKKDRRFLTRGTKPNVCILTPIRFTTDELDLLCPQTIGRAKHSGGAKTLDLFEPSRHEIEAFWNQFRDADTFGSLIRPDAALIQPLRHHVDELGAATLGAAELHEAARTVLRQAEMLARRYAVVVANPPYLGTRNMGDMLRRFAEEQYGESKADLMTMFMVRASGMVEKHGYWGMINLPSWMALASSLQLRQWLLGGQCVVVLAQMGRGIFGADFGSVAFVIQNEVPSRSATGVYRRLYENQVDVRPPEVIESLFRTADYNRFVVAQHALAELPGAPLAFWLPEQLRDAFKLGLSVAEFANPRQGVATADNDQFLRRWWEVSHARINFESTSRSGAAATGAKWFPYNKGGEFRRWAGNREFVINWESDGAAIRAFGTEDGGRPRSAIRNPVTFFQPSVSWSGVTVGSPGFRQYPYGSIHDVTGMSIFGTASKRDDLLGILNSTTVTALLQAVAPTFNIQIGDVSVVPVIEAARNPDGAAACVEAATKDWDDFEVSWDFTRPSLVDRVVGRLSSEMNRWAAEWAGESAEQQRREVANNRRVADAYGVAGVIPTDVALSKVTMARNVEFRHGSGKSAAEYAALERSASIHR